MSTIRSILYATSLISLIFLNGCDTATRDIESEITRNLPQDNEPGSVPVQQEEPAPEPIVIEEPTITDNNETNSTIKIDAKNAYKLSLTLSKDKFQRHELGKLHFSIKELYTNVIVDKSIVKKIVLTTPDTRYCKFVDFNGAESNTLTIQDNYITSDADIAIKMGDNSGTTEIRVISTITLPNGTEANLTNSIPVVVINNQTASIAMNSYGTRWDPSLGLYVQNYVIHVVDKYGNKAKDGTYVSIGALNDPKLYTSGLDATDNPINVTASLSTDKKFTLQTADPAINLDKIDSQDNVVILANKDRNNPAYLGGWSIGTIDSPTQMTLFDDYTGNQNMNISNVDGLSFVIGDEERFNSCYETIANGAFYFPEGTTVKDGIVKAEYRYQPYMVGKTVFLYANAVIDGEKIGISRKVPLVGEGLEPVTASCKNDGNTTLPICQVRVVMKLKGSEKLARWVQPGVIIADHSTFGGLTVSNTECAGSSLVTFYSIAPNKTASVSIGDLIVDEKIYNK
jgi:hypothetical protein